VKENLITKRKVCCKQGPLRQQGSMELEGSEPALLFLGSPSQHLLSNNHNLCAWRKWKGWGKTSQCQRAENTCHLMSILKAKKGFY